MPYAQVRGIAIRYEVLGTSGPWVALSTRAPRGHAEPRRHGPGGGAGVAADDGDRQPQGPEPRQRPGRHPPDRGARLPAAAGAAPDEGARLMLQAGAYKSAQDADGMRARLALLGLDAKVSTYQQDGATVLYRVRLGPYGGLDDLSGIRRTLAENGIEAQVVHSP